MARRPAKASFPVAQSELSRDVYGFAVRPQLLERYKEYAVIYKEEEAERSARWERFLMTYGESAPSLENHVSADTDFITVGPEQKEQIVNDEVVGTVRNGDGVKWESGGSRKFETWGQVRASLWPVERALRSRFKKNIPASGISGSGVGVLRATELEPAESSNRSSAEGSGDESEEEFYDVERSDVLQDGAHGSPELLNESNGNVEHEQESCPWKQELDALVRGGVPMALRGELWQVFVGTTTRRVQGHYQALLTLLADGGGDSDGIGGLYSGTSTNYSLSDSGILEKWTSQIEKDLPRTFPGHPALDEDGRNALRHLLTAYARHNPDVGYCQAMNFFAALLLLMMPEENAFWTLTGIIGEYFEGYYSEKMLESQVDQLVLEDLVRKHFPKLVHHLDNVGVQVAWVSGPWFLSIFVNILPWESVLRVWDVLLYEGNRSILFRTALALIELHGSEIMATKDAGDAVATLQTLAGSTFDSSQLVLIACMGYQSVSEPKLRELALKHRPQVLAALSERSLERSIWHGANGTVPVSQQSGAVLDNAKASISSVYEDGVASDGILDTEENSAADLVEQVKWLKMELSRALEESRAATVRAEELESAFMELVKEDNRRYLSAKVETLEAEVAQLRQALADKEEQENAMVQVMLRMEHEQRLAEDARRYAENDATAQRQATSLLQAKYEDAVSSLSKMEERTVMAETMLEATLQYQALDNDRVALSKRSAKATREEESSRWSWPRSSPKSVDSSGSSAGLAGSTFSRKLEGGDLIKEQLKSRNADPLLDLPEKQGVLSRRFSLNWLEKPKGKIGTSNTQTVLSPSVQGSEHDSGFSSVSLSPQDSLDSSQITSLCQDESHGNTDASTLGELFDSTGTHSNIKSNGK